MGRRVSLCGKEFNETTAFYGVSVSRDSARHRENTDRGETPGDTGVLPPDGSPVRITGRIDTRTSETIILKSISIIQNDLKYSYSGKLQCELEN